MTVRYHCPHGCGARYSTENAAKRCPCQPTGDDDDPNHGPVRAIQNQSGALEITAGGEQWLAARPHAVVDLGGHA